jgi:hypothetical protein
MTSLSFSHRRVVSPTGGTANAVQEWSCVFCAYMHTVENNEASFRCCKLCQTGMLYVHERNGFETMPSCSIATCTLSLTHITYSRQLVVTMPCRRSILLPPLFLLLLLLLKALPRLLPSCTRKMKLHVCRLLLLLFLLLFLATLSNIRHGSSVQSTTQLHPPLPSTTCLAAWTGTPRRLRWRNGLQQSDRLNCHPWIASGLVFSATTALVRAVLTVVATTIA